MSIEKLFRSTGTLHEISKQTPFLLDKENAVFFVEGSPIHLIASHFSTPYKGSILFSNNSLSVVSAEKSRLYEHPIDQLPNLDETLIEPWIEALVFCFHSPLPQGNQITASNIEIKSSQEEKLISYDTSQILTFGKHLVWVKVIEGELLISDNKTLSLKPNSSVFPLMHPMWVKTSIKSQIRIIPTPILHEWKKAILSLNTLFNVAFPLYLKKYDAENDLHRKNRITEQEKTFQEALEQSKELLSETEPLFSQTAKTSLEKALLHIGRKLNIEFTHSKHTDNLKMICEASQIRYRKVILDQESTKEHLGPLLCFQNGIPVAYIDGAIILPNKKTTKFENIDPIAYMFYPPIPSNVKNGKQIWTHILKTYFKSDVSLLLYGIGATIISFLLPISTSLLFKYAIPLKSISLSSYLFLGLIFASIGFMIFYFLRNFCFLKFEGLVIHFTQTALWDRLLKLSPSFFRKFSAGALFWKMASIEAIRQLITDNATYTILNGFFSVFYLIMMFIYSPLLGLISALIAALSLLATLLLIRKKATFLTQEAQIQETLQGTTLQIVSGISKLRTTGSEKNAFAHWAFQFTKSKSLKMKAQNIQNIVSTYSASLPIFSMWVIYFTMIEIIGIKNLALSDFLAFNIAFGSFSLAIYPFNETIISLVAILPFWHRTKVILEEPVEEHSHNVRSKTLSGKIDIANMTFHYDPSLPPTLDNISLTAQAGEFIGIVGASGSGKSTLVRLLLGFEKPSSGVIYYDDQNIATLNLNSLRNQIGSVLQTSNIMTGTIYENIIGGGIYSPTQIKQAIELSGFKEDLLAFPMGLHTFIATNGNTLSGGQKQRLLLARALIGSPSILMFDEATSALDNQTQRLVTKNIDSLNVTRIVIAQRLSTIQHADRIYVLDKGRIAQTGTFEELSKIPGIFKDMFDRQKL